MKLLDYSTSSEGGGWHGGVIRETLEIMIGTK